MAFGLPELLLVLFVILLVIGPRRIANLGRALGRGVRDFKFEFGGEKKSEELSEGEREEKTPPKG